MRQHGPVFSTARIGGFTTLELVVALAISGILSSVALPAFNNQIDKARRADAIGALSAAQMAQEQWRANQPLYGTLAEIGVAAASPAGRYALQVIGHSAHAYELLATAQGLQARDADCRFLRLGMNGGNPVHASGPDSTVGNPPALNRQCWSL
jgi:type IV pilus assembly protein PilE